jgi:glycosyltransferase involved in cell wall biosynthesis
MDIRTHADNFRTLEFSNFSTSSWQLVIAGPDEQGTKEKLKALSEKLNLTTAETRDVASAEDADVVFLGPVYGDEKWALMHRAEIFVLPSRSENFGMVVGEALSCGVPAVTTAVGPWGKGERSLARADGRGDGLPLARTGLFVVETSVEGIAEGLRRMMALSDAERKEMGRQGCEWVRREFSWESVARQMVEAYEEVLKF